MANLLPFFSLFIYNNDYMGFHFTRFVQTNEEIEFRTNFKINFIFGAIAIPFGLIGILSSCLFRSYNNAELNKAKNSGALIGAGFGMLCNIPFLIGFILGIAMHKPLFLLLGLLTIALAILVGKLSLKSIDGK